MKDNNSDSLEQKTKSIFQTIQLKQGRNWNDEASTNGTEERRCEFYEDSKAENDSAGEPIERNRRRRV